MARILFFISYLVCIFSVHASITKMNVSENTASKIMVDGTNTYIFGGSAGSCSGTLESNSVCNSCGQITDLCTDVERTACNSRSVHSDLKLEIIFQVDEVPTSASISAKLGTTVLSISEQSSTIEANKDLYVRILWSELIEASDITLCGSTDSDDCGEGKVSGDLTIGLSTDSGSTFSVSKVYKFEYRGVKATDSSRQDFHTDCGDSSQTADSGEGFCNFSVYPGDGKVYVKDLKRASIAPSNTTHIKWAAARFYYTETGSDFCALSPSLKTYTDLSVVDRTTIDTTLTSKKIENLNNGTLYRFMMASMDDAGNVEYFSNPNSSGGYLKDSAHSATPTEVVGLLDGKKCFIATAAFGSEMDPRVEILRVFRDQIMLKFKFGKFLVKTYYRFSPPLAEFISNKPWLRTFVRGLLWPIVSLADFFVEQQQSSFSKKLENP